MVQPRGHRCRRKPMQVAILQEEDGAITWARGQGGNLAGAGNLVRVGQAGGWVKLATWKRHLGKTPLARSDQIRL